MDCQKCHELLSDFLDRSLTGDDHNLLSAHLEDCLTCADAHGDLQMLAALAKTDFVEYAAPPDAQNLWLRIREQVEDDMTWAQTSSLQNETRAQRTIVATQSQNWWSRVWNARWEVSAPQVTAFAAVALVAVIISAAGLGIRQMPIEFGNTSNGIAGNAPASASSLLAANEVSGDVNAARRQQISFDEYVRQQQAEAQVWLHRVETRKARFSPQMRESYERSLASLDQTVSYSLNELRQNPRDQISEETLNAALREKAELLKEFSEY